jgi:hypothetical protein
MAAIAKGARITGEARNKLAAKLHAEYKKGASIRTLADTHHRSYGFIHQVLAESGLPLRARGRPTQTKASSKKR